MQRDGFGTVHPFARGVDFTVGLDSRHHGRRGRLHVARFFDEFLERRPDIALAFLEQSGRGGVAVDVAPVCETILGRNCLRTMPENEGVFDVLALLVRTDQTLGRMPV